MTRPKLIGLPWDGSSSFLRGPAGAPSTVRTALHGGSANYTTELGTQVDPELWVDLGDVELPGDAPADAHAAITAAVTDAAADGAPVLSIGGDHLFQ